MQKRYLLTALLAFAFAAFGCSADIIPQCTFIVDDGICERCLDPDETQTCKAEQKMLNHYLQQGLDPYEQGMLCSQFRNEWYGACDACADRVSDVCMECDEIDDKNLCNAEFLQLQANVVTQGFSIPSERIAYCRTSFLSSWSARCGLPNYCKHISKVCDYCEVTETVGRGQEEIINDEKTAALQEYCGQVIGQIFGTIDENNTCDQVWEAVYDNCSYETLLSIKNSFSSNSPSDEQ